VGGGITGIAAAIQLAKSGRFEITLFEKEKQFGGLSTYYRWNNLTFDRFYHVILSTDRVMIQFLRELDLENELFWTETKTGFYGENRLVSLSSTSDFIKFPFMTVLIILKFY